MHIPDDRYGDTVICVSSWQQGCSKHPVADKIKIVVKRLSAKLCKHASINISCTRRWFCLDAPTGSAQILCTQYVARSTLHAERCTQYVARIRNTKMYR